MTKKSEFPIDYKKLKPEDRKLLLGLLTDDIRSNENLSLTLLSLYGGMTALIVSIYALIISIENGFTPVAKVMGLFYLDCFLACTLMVMYGYKFFSKREKFLDKKSKELFEIHFKYAGRKRSRNSKLGSEAGSRFKQWLKQI